MPKKENNDRRYPGINGLRPDNKKHKKEEAKERQEFWDKLSTREKIARLDMKLGAGVGAKKQRARLQALLDGGK